MKSPWRGRWIVGIKPCRVELIRRIYDTRTEELCPNVINAGPRELKITRNILRQRGAVFLTGGRGFATKQICGGNGADRADGLPRRPVASGGVQRIVGSIGIERPIVVIDDAGCVGVQRKVEALRARFGEKSRQAPSLGASCLTAPQAERVEVSASIMTKNAIHMSDAQKRVCDVRRLLVINILSRSAGHYTQGEKIDLPVGLVKAVGALCRDHFRGHLVVGFTRRQ